MAFSRYELPHIVLNARIFTRRGTGRHMVVARSACARIQHQRSLLRKVAASTRQHAHAATVRARFQRARCVAAHKMLKRRSEAREHTYGHARWQVGAACAGRAGAAGKGGDGGAMLTATAVSGVGATRKLAKRHYLAASFNDDFAPAHAPSPTSSPSRRRNAAAVAQRKPGNARTAPVTPTCRAAGRDAAVQISGKPSLPLHEADSIPA